MSNHLARKKALLLRQIQRQRQDLLNQKQAWLNATAGFDQGWQRLFSFRKYLVIGGGLLTAYGLRRPGKLFLWGRRAFGVWSTVRLVRSKLGHKTK